MNSQPGWCQRSVIRATPVHPSSCIHLMKPQKAAARVCASYVSCAKILGPRLTMRARQPAGLSTLGAHLSGSHPRTTKGTFNRLGMASPSCVPRSATL